VLLKEPPAGEAVNTIEEAATLNLPTLNYGMFITHIIDFVIIAFAIFMMIKLITKARETADNIRNRGKVPDPAPVPTTKICPFCITEINIKATKCPNCTSQL
jgi:large conductance mechanosensitive channel